MAQSLTIHGILDYIEFNIIKETKFLGINQLQDLDELFKELSQIVPDTYDLNARKSTIRKNILDSMNNSIRQTRESFTEIKKII